MSLYSILRFGEEVIPQIEKMLDMEREHLKHLESEKLKIYSKVNIFIRYSIDKYIKQSKFRIDNLEFQIMVYKEYFRTARESNKD
jgi:hypothetical protein